MLRNRLKVERLGGHVTAFVQVHAQGHQIGCRAKGRTLERAAGKEDGELTPARFHAPARCPGALQWVEQAGPQRPRSTRFKV